MDCLDCSLDVPFPHLPYAHTCAHTYTHTRLHHIATYGGHKVSYRLLGFPENPGKTLGSTTQQLLWFLWDCLRSDWCTVLYLLCVSEACITKKKKVNHVYYQTSSITPVYGYPC